MAKSNRQRILHGGSLQPTSGQPSLFRWPRVLGRRTVEDDELSDSNHVDERRPSKNTSTMLRTGSKKKAAGGSEGRNAGPSAEVQSRASTQGVDITSLPARLRPHGERMNKMVQILSDLAPALTDFATGCSEHANEVDGLDHVLTENARLRTENEEQMNDITSLKNSMRVFNRQNDGEQKRLEDSRTKLEEEQMELSRERELTRQKLVEQTEEQKRALAVDKQQLEYEYEVLKNNLNSEYEEEKRSSAQIVEAEKKEAVRTFEKQKKKLEAERASSERRATSLQKQLEELEKEKGSLVGKNKDLTRLKDSLESENESLKAKVAGFSSQSRPLTHYVTAFDEIERRIHNLAAEYLLHFPDVLQKGLDAIHEELKQSDRLFEAVPISNSPESSRLCRAHIQRVIALNIVETIWRPFSCDGLMDESGLAGLLLDVHGRVAGGSHKGSRQEIFWTTQTCRALQAVRSSGLAKDLKNAGAIFRGASRTRAERAFAAIESVVRPLIDGQKTEEFQTGLMIILNDCVELWDGTMIDEVWFEAETSLGSTFYAQCRSKEFDSVDEREKDGSQIDAQPPAHDDVLMLFPRIRAWNPDFEEHKDTTPKAPGWCPDDDDNGDPAQECKDTRKDKVVHTGCALATTSQLVVMGRKQVDVQATILEQVRDEAVEDFRNRNMNHKRWSSDMSAITLVGSMQERE